MTRNIFVVGLDDLNLETLRALPGADEYTFHTLLEREDLQEGSVSVPDLLDQAHRQLEAFEGRIDAIIGYWDFPVNMLVPILCQRYGLRSADLEAVVKCEHKYWSRLEQQKVITEHPAFGLIDPADQHPSLPPGVSYPAWIKPVESTESEGAYYVEDDEQLREALAREREEIHRLGDPFNDILAMLDLPPEVADVGGTGCLVEEAATGEQYTVEGFSRGGRVEVYGVIDSLTYPGLPSFLRYQYPSRLPARVRDYMADVSRRVITGIGLANTTFNIEYFWDPEQERLSLLEVNARHSQSHAPLFQLVDGAPNHAVLLDLALDRDPQLARGQGPYATAAKWYLRHFTDGLVRRVPSPEQVAQVEQEVPGSTLQVAVEEGSQLSDGYGGDSYSYVLAEIFLGAPDEDELVRRYDRCVAALDFEIEDVQEGA
ncbi:ATP-grasp domain-containing protein [Ornithinicoccus halotolerans]|uniref:ATP-grasp domain-containing protein n=1 Tax=Ornithinicoccus halotolerans TaxID=1748220 RepID=UPI001296E006|nr:ATP-grasp domain-containing protein [Ornithinicoccus halotolerans]